MALHTISAACSCIPPVGTGVRPQWARLLLASLIALSSCGVGVASAAPTTRAQVIRQMAPIPADLLWARRLVAEVAPPDNVYVTDTTIVRWAGVDGARRAVNRSVCSTFVDRVVEQAYGYPAPRVTAWLGLYARTIHQAIAQRRGFFPITAVAAIEPGDVMAIEYYDDDRPSTGHVMIVDHVPQPIQALAPLIPGTGQYTVAVIDSAMSGHGPTDTRAEKRGRWQTGIGRGLFRLYADAQGHIAGYSWSPTAGSTFYPPTIRDVLVGRLTRVPRSPTHLRA